MGKLDMKKRDPMRVREEFAVRWLEAMLLVSDICSSSRRILHREAKRQRSERKSGDVQVMSPSQLTAVYEKKTLLLLLLQPHMHSDVIGVEEDLNGRCNM